MVAIPNNPMTTNEQAGGEPAFPTTILKTQKYMDEGGYGRTRTVTMNTGGLTKREYFAGLAMQALIAREHGKGENDQFSQVALTAKGYADAMLAESRKEGR